VVMVVMVAPPFPIVPHRLGEVGGYCLKHVSYARMENDGDG
jgi:hypothetical protein